jgi:GNAT superfamily N-acetyltransferase
MRFATPLGLIVVRHAPSPVEVSPMHWSRDTFSVTCDPAKLDRQMIAKFLSSSYWANGIPPATVEKSLQNSLCFGLMERDRQVGFARVITDHATIAYLGDVFVLPEHRGKGLSKWLMECVMSHPDLQGLRRWMLATRDAHGLYERFGFTALKKPEVFMELHNPDVYRGGA